MKKLIPLMLAAAFVFFGFNKANAAVTTVTLTSYGSTATTGLASSPQLSLQNNQAIYGFTLTGSGGTTTAQTVKSLTFLTSAATNAFNNAFFTTLTLWSSTTSSTFSTTTASVVPGAVATLGANYNSIVLTPTTALTVPPSTTATTWYFLVMNYTIPSPSTTNDTWQLNYSTGTTGTGAAIASGTTTTGYNYVFSPLTITAADVTAGLNPAVGSTIYYGQSGLAVAGISLKMTTAGSTANLSSLVFGVTPASTFSSYFTAQLYSSTSATFSLTGATPATLVTGATPTVGTSTVSFAITGTTVTSTIMYYYLVLNYGTAGTTPKTFTFTPSSYTTALSATAVTTTYATNTYICGTPGPFVLTLSSLTSNASTDGLSATPVVYGSTNYSVYGFSLIGSGSTAGTTTINTLTFVQNGTSTDADNLYYTTAYLYSSTTAAYVPGTTNVAGNLVGTATSDGTSTITFNTSIAASNSTNMYYFIVLSNTLGDANTSTFDLTYSSSTVSSTAITTGTGLSGPAYTFKPVPPTTVTITSIGAGGATPGSGLVANPISTLQSGIAIYGFTLAGSGSGTSQTVSSLSFLTNGTTFANNNEFFPTVTLYSSTSPTFLGVGNAATSASLNGTGTVLTASDIAAIVITPTTALTVTSSTTPTYYFLVVNYTTPAASYANNTYGLNYSTATTGSGAALTSGTTTTGFNYTFTSLSITAADITAGLNPVSGSNIYQGQSGLAVAGISLKTGTAGTTATLSQLVFTVSPSVATENNYFTNPPVLYSSTSATFSLTGATPATAVTGATATPGTATLTYNISPGVSLTNTATYYYLVLNYSAGGTVPQIFTFTPSSYTTSFNTAAVNTTYATNTYTCSAPVSVGAASTTGLATSPIAGSQTGIGIFGFSASAYPATTFTSFTISTTVSNISTYFSNVTLYSSTTNSFAAATPVAAGYMVSVLTGSSFTISNLTQTITNSTLYYFIVVNYTAPTANVSFQPTLTGFTTSTTTYTSASAGCGLNVTGTVYTLSPAAPYTYYWYGNGATTDWKSPANWITNTANNTNAGTYPGATATDVATFNSNYFADGGPLEYPTIGAYNITLATISITDYSAAEITINNGNSLNLTTLTLNSAFDDGAEFGVYNSNTTTTSTTPIVNISGVTTVGTACDIYLAGTNSNVSFASTSSTTINGTANYPAFIVADGGIMTAAAGSTFTLAGVDATIQFATGSTLTATGATFNLTGNYTTLGAFGGIMNFNAASIINVSGTGTVNKPLGLYINSGTIATDASTVNLGTTAANGSKSMIDNLGGIFTAADNSVINLNGPTTLITSASINLTTGTTIDNINNSTVNLGTTTITGSGATAEISNTEEAVFNLNAGSLINMNGTNTEILNSSTTLGGSTYYGVFIAASTSIINPTSTTAIVSNGAQASNYFTLLSDINGAATIGKLGAGAKLSGLFNVQRYINGGQSYYRDYRLLSSPVNKSSATSNATNLVDLSYLGAQATIPYTTPATTYYGAFIAGPGNTFGGGIHTIANPLIYLYQENIVPGSAYNAQFTSGKNVGVTSLNTTAFYAGTTSTAAGAGSESPASSAPSVVSTAIALPAYDNSTTAMVPPGNACLFFYIDNDARTTSASTTSIPNSSNITASGYINQAQVQLYLWGSDSPYLTDTYGLSGVRLPGIAVVGNPYPSTIDLKQVYTDNVHAVTPSLYQLDVVTQQFDTYNASTNSSSTSLSSEYVASGQGFYIHADSLATTKLFYFQEDQKMLSTTVPFFPPISNFALIPHQGQIVDNVSLPANTGKTADNVSVTKQNQTLTPSVNGLGSDPVKTLASTGKTPFRKGTLLPVTSPSLPPAVVTPPDNVTPEIPQAVQTPVINPVVNPALLHLKFVVDSVDNDEVALAFNSAWSDKFDRNDSFDLDGEAGKVYLSSYTSDDVRTSVNALGDYTGGKRVKLFVKASTAGIFQVQMSDISNFDTNDYSVFLIDNFKSDSLDLTLYKSYNFNYAPGTANDSTRFVLAIEHKPVPYYALLTFAGQKVTQGVQLNWTVKNEFNTTKFVVQKLGANNTYFFLDSLQSGSSSVYDYIDQHPTLGNNTYRLQQTTALGVITYSAPVTIGYNSTSPNGGLNIYPNPAKSQITVTLTTGSTATQVATADIYNTSGTLIEHKVVNSNSFTHDVSSYQLGVYIIELKNSNGLLVGKSKFVKVQ